MKFQLNVEHVLDNDDLQVLTSAYNPSTSSINKFCYHNLPLTDRLSATCSF